MLNQEDPPLLFDLDIAPNERVNLADPPEYADTVSKFESRNPSAPMEQIAVIA